MCTLCTIAAGTGLIIFRRLGIDDSITGLWIGGLLISLTLVTINWLKSKNVRFFGMNFLTGAIYFAAILIPFYQKKIISQKIFDSHHQTLFGVDKLVLGIFVGGIFLLLGVIAYEIIKKRNDGHAHFPFEKVVLPISPLIILSAIFYFMTK